RAGELFVSETMDAEHDGLPRLDLTDAVGRHQPLEAQAAGIDDLQQFLADLRGIARGHLAIAHDAIERRTHFGALQLLAGGDDTRARGLPVALRSIATVLG